MFYMSKLITFTFRTYVLSHTDTGSVDTPDGKSLAFVRGLQLSL